MPEGFHLALIAVGSYQLRSFMKERHVNLAEAVQIHQDLKAKRNAGVHCGCFNLTDESLDQQPKDLTAVLRERGLAADAFTVVAIGETRVLSARATS